MVSAFVLTAATAFGGEGHDKDKDGDRDGRKQDPAHTATSASAPSRDGAEHGLRDRDADAQPGRGDADAPREARRESREQRERRADYRRHQIEKIRAALGGVKVLGEEQRRVIREHYRVIARLQAIVVIAESEANQSAHELVTRANAALVKEDARFFAKVAVAATPAAAVAASAGRAP